MLQNLLAERFQLKLHREQKEQSIYALVVGKNGPKLKESAPEPAPTGDAPPPPPPPPGGRMVMGKDGMPQLPRGGRGMMMMIGNGRFRMRGNGQAISAVTDMLSNQLGRPVVDQTGLTGKYDIELEFMPEEGSMMRGPMGGMPMPPPGAGPGPAPGDGAQDSSPAPNLFTAVQEQLGLKLEPKKGPVEQLVIDHIEKTPVEN